MILQLSIICAVLSLTVGSRFTTPVDFNRRANSNLRRTRLPVIVKAQNNDHVNDNSKDPVPGTPEYSEKFAKDLEEENKLFKNKPIYDAHLYYMNHGLRVPDDPDNLQAIEGPIMDKRRLMKAWKKNNQLTPGQEEQKYLAVVGRGPSDQLHGIPNEIDPKADTNPIKQKRLIRADEIAHVEYYDGYWPENKIGVIVKTNTDETGMKSIENEIRILNKFRGKDVRHVQQPISKFITINDKEEHIYNMLFEKCQDISTVQGKLELIALVAYGMTYGLVELSNKRIGHMNINLDNVVICNGVVQFTNFGYAQDINKNGVAVIPLSQMDPQFRAPESASMYKQQSIDLFAMGQVLHYLLYHVYSTAATTASELKDYDTYYLTERTEDVIRLELCHLAKWLMHVDPNKRPTIKQILFHPSLQKLSK